MRGSIVNRIWSVIVVILIIIAGSFITYGVGGYLFANAVPYWVFIVCGVLILLFLSGVGIYNFSTRRVTKSFRGRR